VAALGDSILLAEQPASATNQYVERFKLWNVTTGAVTPLWETPVGQQDFVWDVSGSWMAIVRTGLSLPFAEWHLILRNVTTGETREIAANQAGITETPGLNVGLPTGFAPSPSMSGSRVVWAEFHRGSDGSLHKRIEMYDMADGQEKTLESVAAPAEDVSQPSLAGQEVAWIHRPSADKAELVVEQLDTGKRLTVPVDSSVYSCGLTADGRYLAWDIGYQAKYALDLTTGKTVQYAGSEGWGTVRDGNLLSWQPSTAVGSADKGGYYDTATGLVHFVQPQQPDSMIITATALGGWFTWQDRNQQSDNYYFVRISGN
jgi:hypothetical protein